MRIPNLHIYTYLIGLLAICSLAGCNGSSQQTCGHTATDTVYAPKYATGFTITRIPGKESTLITVSNPWQGAHKATRRLWVRRNGEKIPQDLDAQVIDAPVQRIVCMSSTQIAMLDALDMASSVCGVSVASYVSNDYIRANIDKIPDVGYEGNVNYEAIAASRPDIVLIYGVGAQSSCETKLRSLGIPFLYVCDYLEESPLGKAEWMVALGDIVNKRTQAQKYFDPLVQRYNALRRHAATASSPRPTVMLNTPYGDAWFLPSPQNYMARLIADAGGIYVNTYDSGNASRPVDTEEALRMLNDADIWLNAGDFRKLDDLRGRYPRFADTPPVRNGHVFVNTLRATPNGGNDYFESGVVHPDLVLRDMIKIFHPQLVSEPFVYHQQLQ